MIVCNLHELYVAFKKKNSNVKIPPNFVLSFRSGVPLLDQRIHFHCVYVVFTIIVVLLDDAINRGISYKDPTKKVVWNPFNKECMMHRCDNCPGTDALFEFLDKKLGGFYADEHFHSFLTLGNNR